MLQQTAMIVNYNVMSCLLRNNFVIDHDKRFFDRPRRRPQKLFLSIFVPMTQHGINRWSTIIFTLSCIFFSVLFFFFFPFFELNMC